MDAANTFPFLADPYLAALIITATSFINLPTENAWWKLWVKFDKDETVHQTPYNNTQSVNETFKLLVRKSERRYFVNFELWKKTSYFFSYSRECVAIAELKLEKIMNSSEKQFNKVISFKTPDGTVCAKLQLQITKLDSCDVEIWFWKGLALHFARNYNESKQNETRDTLSKEQFTKMIYKVGAPADERSIHNLFKKLRRHDSCVLISDFEEWMRNNPDNLLANYIFQNADDRYSLMFETFLMNDGDEISSLVMLKDPSAPSPPQQVRRKDIIYVQDRKTGKIIEEKMPNYLRTMMRMMYTTPTGRSMVLTQFGRDMLRKLTFNQGKKYSSVESAKEIPGFIRFHNIDMSEVLHPISSFKTFNEFFARELKPGARPVAFPDDATVAVCPADCRLLVFETIDSAKRFWVKGTNFSLSTLLQNPKLEKKFEGGSFVIARLAPQDYHRFHFPVSGKVKDFWELGTEYFTVNPMAVREEVDVFTENKRIGTVVKTNEFGLVAIIAVGATAVGSIIMTCKPNTWVNKGDEMGYFMFGGSTVLLLFQQDRIVFDEDLMLNSAKQLETLVQANTSLGRVKRKENGAAAASSAAVFVE